MKLIEIQWSPTDRQLRQFGAVCLVALPAIAWFWGGNTTVIQSFAGLGLAAAGIGLLFPQWLKPVFLALSVAAIPIGIVIGEVAMLLIYFGLFLPFSIAFRLTRRDALQLGRSTVKTSYWQEKKKPTDVSSYYRQS